MQIQKTGRETLLRVNLGEKTSLVPLLLLLLLFPVSFFTILTSHFIPSLGETETQ
jgi:hypothetical protein